MSISDADIAFALELFDGLGPLTTRKMMGGLCLYQEGTIFAILHGDGSIWLKGAGAFSDRITAEGWTRWTYSRDGGKVTAMPYWRLPDAALDDPEAACKLARDALSQLK
ncbi:MAG: TfoX/Sxy family protein [Paracoccaceae bacterium]|jgi:DNA transformation protein|nr:TfoX/Sxy family protein [Paracoccaceae bacterium]MDH5531076.1 TfoX/Sxy family protein [Paracoccaceae bacterium]